MKLGDLVLCTGKILGYLRVNDPSSLDVITEKVPLLVVVIPDVRWAEPFTPLPKHGPPNVVGVFVNGKILYVYKRLLRCS